MLFTTDKRAGLLYGRPATAVRIDSVKGGYDHHFTERGRVRLSGFVLPGESRKFWTKRGVKTSRIGSTSGAFMFLDGEWSTSVELVTGGAS